MDSLIAIPTELSRLLLEYSSNDIRVTSADQPNESNSLTKTNILV
jgi:hypothetical protein